ncbi:MAG: hypothetical protein NTZ78_02460 [Candidatus Aureabacteria bacterium]|nr:hypothetical protein [Candidatus Auribacterota bacterium]
MPRSKVPRNFKQVKIGDRWIEFAYIKDEIDRERCSLIMGFYECTREARYGDVSLRRRRSAWIDDWIDRAWMIEGKRYGEQPRYKPVSVPSIQDMLGRKVFERVTIMPIHGTEFIRIRKVALNRQLDPKMIPHLGREPLNEQEVLSIVVGGHSALGIDKIIEVQTRFPDMLGCIQERSATHRPKISLGVR